MKRADELRIQQRWRRNLEHAANSHPFLGPLFANGRPLSVEQASTWLKATMRQAQSHVRLISTQPEQAFELLRERLQAASHCASPIHLCVSNYQGSACEMGLLSDSGSARDRDQLPRSPVFLVLHVAPIPALLRLRLA